MYDDCDGATLTASANASMGPIEADPSARTGLRPTFLVHLMRGSPSTSPAHKVFSPRPMRPL
jgi:hypothetical protein